MHTINLLDQIPLLIKTNNKALSKRFLNSKPYWTFYLNIKEIQTIIIIILIITVVIIIQHLITQVLDYPISKVFVSKVLGHQEMLKNIIINDLSINFVKNLYFI